MFSWYSFIRDASNLAALENSSKEEFIAAASRGDEKEIRRILLESNAHLKEGDYDKRTALHLACENGHTTVALVLCEARADVNAQDRFGKHKFGLIQCISTLVSDFSFLSIRQPTPRQCCRQAPCPVYSSVDQIWGKTRKAQ